MSSIPLQSALPRTYRIKEIVQNTPLVKTFTFDGSLGAKPGQFVMAWIPGVDEVPLSVALDDGAETKLTFFAVGDATQALAAKKVGELVGLRGPLGTSYEWRPGQHLALVAGGYGAAPMYFVASEAVKHGCTMEVIVSARSKEHLLYITEISALQNVAVHVATDDGSLGFKGYGTQLLEALLSCHGDPTNIREHAVCDRLHKSAPIDQVFSCGPERMLMEVYRIATQFGVPSQISFARYMKCGFGLCGTCVLEPLGIRLCTEGPVLKSEVIAKITEFGTFARDGQGVKHALK